MRIFCFSLIVFLSLATGNINAQYTVLHNFNDTLGRAPDGSLTMLGNKFYGMADLEENMRWAVFSR